MLTIKEKKEKVEVEEIFFVRSPVNFGICLVVDVVGGVEFED